MNENGPGSYDIQEILDRRWHKGIVMKGKYTEHIEQTPGPEDYKPNYDFTTFRTATPRQSFPRSRSSTLRVDRDVPGVGTYNLRRESWAGHGLTMGSRTFGEHL